MHEGKIIFGPVPSRRLGRSLGINNIPPKICSYSCLYCQVGRTETMQIARQPFYDPGTICKEVKRKIEEVAAIGETIDFLTLVPDGEPTLDINLGRTIDLLRPLGIRIAVISNGSLLGQEGVMDELSRADWVSLKVDSVKKESWRRINRPHHDLDLPRIHEAMLQFAERYTGRLVSETMLVAGINDSPEDISQVADFLARLKPATAYLSIPTRPPAEARVHPPTADHLNRAYQIVSRQIDDVECLFGDEGSAFSLTGDLEEELFSILAVHPMQEEAVHRFLAKGGEKWTLIDTLIAQGRLLVADYEGKRFYLPSLQKRDG
ncbi:MAG: radical SAM protein [Pseudomonadota bacterium]